MPLVRLHRLEIGSAGLRDVKFGGRAESTTLRYLEVLGTYRAGRVGRLNILLYRKDYPKPDGTLKSHRFVGRPVPFEKERHVYREVYGVMEVERIYDLDRYWALDDGRHMVLDIIHEEMLLLADEFGWDKKQLYETYEKLQDDPLDYWKFDKRVYSKSREVWVRRIERMTQDCHEIFCEVKKKGQKAYRIKIGTAPTFGLEYQRFWGKLMFMRSEHIVYLVYQGPPKHHQFRIDINSQEVRKVGNFVP